MIFFKIRLLGTVVSQLYLASVNDKKTLLALSTFLRCKSILKEMSSCTSQHRVRKLLQTILFWRHYCAKGRQFGTLCFLTETLFIATLYL